jgi:hypothetical protein
MKLRRQQQMLSKNIHFPSKLLPTFFGQVKNLEKGFFDKRDRPMDFSQWQIISAAFHREPMAAKIYQTFRRKVAA